MTRRVTKETTEKARRRVREADPQALRHTLLNVVDTVAHYHEDANALTESLYENLRSPGFLPLGEPAGGAVEVGRSWTMSANGKGTAPLADGWVRPTPDRAQPMPEFLGELLSWPRLPVSAQRPAKEWFEEGVLPAFTDAAHKLFNDTCRICGVEVDNTDSEHTSCYAVDLGDRLGAFIDTAWRQQDERTMAQEAERADKARQLREAEATVRRLKKELHLPNEETS